MRQTVGERGGKHIVPASACAGLNLSFPFLSFRASNRTSVGTVAVIRATGYGSNESAVIRGGA